MEQKAHEIKFLELSIQSAKQKIKSDFCCLPTDLTLAEREVMELEQLVKLASLDPQ